MSHMGQNIFTVISLLIIPLLILTTITPLTISQEYTPEELLEKLPNYDHIKMDTIKEQKNVINMTYWHTLLDKNNTGNWWTYYSFYDLFPLILRKQISNLCGTCRCECETLVYVHPPESILIIHWNESNNEPYKAMALNISLLPNTPVNFTALETIPQDMADNAIESLETIQYDEIKIKIALTVLIFVGVAIFILYNRWKKPHIFDED